jgi:hypothetical protein
MIEDNLNHSPLHCPKRELLHIHPLSLKPYMPHSYTTRRRKIWDIGFPGWYLKSAGYDDSGRVVSLLKAN